MLLQKIDTETSNIIATRNSPETTYALIEFVDIESVEKAILTMHGEIVEGHCIHLTFGTSLGTTCVWIGDIHSSVTKKRLHLLCSQFGNVLYCEIDHTKQCALVFFQKVI